MTGTLAFRLPVEQAIGHILQRLLDHDERLRRIERQLHLPNSEES